MLIHRTLARYASYGIVPLLFLLLSACDGTELAVLPPTATVLAFGDSLTYGTGARREEAYPTVLAELIDMKVINAGVPGEISAKGLQRLRGLLQQHQPDLVVLVHGGNDTLRKLPTHLTQANLLAMIQASRAIGAQVIMLGVPGRSLTLSAPDFYEEVAEENNVPIDADVLPSLMRNSAMKSDPVHFNTEGYRRMAEAVRDLLIASGALASG
ncbi:arylesterase [Congregibacter variabilis]|uniref:Arylesterase n=1 Tax=Congregibacter variabilis TaxID=3081200 RepID=A0ABZ0I1P0_9GAMM|nr:arylesterase [Congregibacter sp. IMCC43200]